jgi:spatacsin
VDKGALTSASHHYLLALSYFLHEKCFSLALECLRKLSLISLQLDVGPELPIMHLSRDEVLAFMRKREFQFALTVAVVYDLDTEETWADAIFEQVIIGDRQKFLEAFQLFKPISAGLTGFLVRRFEQHAASGAAQDITERMKRFLSNIPNLIERYRIAQRLNFTEIVTSMREVNPVVCEWCEKVCT